MSENTQIEKDEITQEDLYYKEAYTYLFSSLSDMMKWQMEIVKEIITLQTQAEAICTTSLPSSKITPELILQLFADMIKGSITDTER